LIGKVFYHQGFYQEALTRLIDAEKNYVEKRTDRMAENLYQLGLVYYNMGADLYTPHFYPTDGFIIPGNGKTGPRVDSTFET
jgi:hypothetical protein